MSRGRGVGSWYWSRKVRPRVLRAAGYRCAVCRERFPAEELEVDHIIPRIVGGPDDMSNLRALCKRHHRERSAGAEPARVVGGQGPLLRRGGS